MDYTKKLIACCSGLTYEALPAEVIQKAKHCILDYIANIYGSLELYAVNSVVNYFRQQNTGGHSTALACDFATNSHSAAFINGVTGEAIEAQDGYRFGGNHPGTAVIPATLVSAEERNADGKKNH